MSDDSLKQRLLDGLNPEQIQVVEHDQGPMLVASVAGSGKTKSIVHRMAYLVYVRGVRPERIFGVTFSRKAAEQMTDRAALLIDGNAVQVQTFHAFCLRVLTEEKLGFERWKLDEDGSKYRYLIKDAISNKHMNWLGGDPEQCSQFIELAKAAGLRPESEEAAAFAVNRYRSDPKPNRKPDKIIEMYMLTESLRKDAFLMTFSDWMMDVRDLFRDSDQARRRWAGLFDYVMVDEAQDNSRVQAEIVEQLSREHRNIMLIGDSAQSIFRFRGAMPELFTNFPQLWNAPTISMNRNYRSGSKIVEVANDALLKMDQKTRCGELIVAERPDAGRFIVRNFTTQEQEAERIVAGIQAIHIDGNPWNSCAVLYRTNTLSRSIEEQLIRNQVPYHIVGSTFFYARKEIATLIAYLKVAWRRGATMDDVKRCLFSPNRFLGHKFLEKIETASKEKLPSFIDTVRRAIVLSERFHGGQQAKAIAWAELIDGLRVDIAAADQRSNPGALIEKVVDATQYKDWLRRDDGENAPDNDRISNVAELARAASAFRDVGAFLQHVKMQLAVFNASKTEAPIDRVTLMSCHRSKGLEWNNVFLITCNDRIMPHIFAEDHEEERRIFYVASTRARDMLHISFVGGAVSGGRIRTMDASPFIDKYIQGSSEHKLRRLERNDTETPSFMQYDEFRNDDHEDDVDCDEDEGMKQLPARVIPIFGRK